MKPVLPSTSLPKWAQERESNPATPSYGLGANPIDFPAIMRPQGRVTWLDLRSGSRGES